MRGPWPLHRAEPSSGSVRVGGRSAPAPVRDGFSLVEMLVALAITTMVLVGVLEVLDMNSRVARKQTMVAEMQQNMRIALYDVLRHARMAGRGGLPAYLPPDSAASPAFGGALLPSGVAVSLRNNVPDGTTVGGNPVLPGSDILTLRGVFFGPVFQVQSNTDDFSNRMLQLDMLALGVPQDLEAIADATLGSGGSESLILVSSRGATLYGLADTASGGSMQTATDADGKARTVGVTVPFTTSGGNAAGYRRLMRSGMFPASMTAVAYMGILEEYRYYVRAAPVDPSDPSAGIVARLSRARFFPGTDTVHPSTPGGREDIADNVIDLQFVLGIDQNGNGQVDDADSDSTDEWLGNSPKDSVDDPSNPGSWMWNGPARQLHSLRMSILVRSERPEIQYVSEPILQIEDHFYNEPATPATRDELIARRHRRRLMQAAVDFRNF